MRPLVLLLLACPLFAQTFPIAAARQRAAGDAVTVLGIVTVPSGRFRAAADEGFAIQDQTGGIWVSTKENLRLKQGQLVLVQGTLAQNAKKLQISAASVTPEKGELRVATGQVGAATLGWIITVEGTIRSITPDPPYGHKVFIDDGSGAVQVFINASTDIDATKLRAGRTIRVTGFGSQYETTYEVEPRSRADLRERQ